MKTNSHHYTVWQWQWLWLSLSLCHVIIRNSMIWRWWFVCMRSIYIVNTAIGARGKAWRTQHRDARVVVSHVYMNTYEIPGLFWIQTAFTSFQNISTSAQLSACTYWKWDDDGRFVSPASFDWRADRVAVCAFCCFGTHKNKAHMVRVLKFSCHRWDFYVFVSSMKMTANGERTATVAIAVAADRSGRAIIKQPTRPRFGVLLCVLLWPMGLALDRWASELGLYLGRYINGRTHRMPTIVANGSSWWCWNWSRWA